MSAAIQHLQRLWGRAMLDGDFDAAKRWREAREHLEVYEARREQTHPCDACPWTHSDTCRTCALGGVRV
jgi:hypothetical protein